MAVTIREREATCNSPQKQYDVVLDGDTEIHTVVTRDPAMVSSWIEKIETLNESNLHNLIVGLDVEWRPNFKSGAAQNRVATLQLCVGKSCLIYQILHSPKIPGRLREFLQNGGYRFVGVGIADDVEKLRNDYRLEVTKTVDLRAWAAEVRGQRNLRTFGLKNLVKEIVGIEVKKPKSVTMSSWNQRSLSPKQISYACLDAYLSFLIGNRLNS